MMMKDVPARRRVGYFLPASLFAFLLLAHGAWASDEDSARREPLPGGSKIAGLKWPESVEIPIRLRENAVKVTPEATLEVEYSKPESSLLLFKGKSETVEPSREGNQYRFSVPLDAVHNTMRIVAVNAFGDIEEEPVAVTYDAYPSVVAQYVVRRKTYHFSLGTELSSIAYRENRTDVAPITVNESAVTVKGAISRAFSWGPRLFDMGISSYLTALPLGVSSEKSARFFGFNARIGYPLPFVHSPWGAAIHTGFYYTTMIVPGNSFGFRNMAGPQLYPTIGRELARDQSIFAYFKLSPVNGSLLSVTQNREMAFGASYIWALKNHRSISAMVDYAALDLLIKSVPISSHSISAGVGFGF